MADFISNNNSNKSRRNTRVDLTPMVDLGFLLITFFVFTTSMTEPKAMSMTEPMEGEISQVPETGATTILLGADNKLLYYFGRLDATGSGNTITSDWNSIRKVIEQKKAVTDINKLMFIVKAAPDSKFKNAIDIMDEMAICDIPAGHYAEADITPQELALLNTSPLP